MKFSVLLPTRNRLDYLRHAVESVRRQDYDDWEVIISDNDSQDGISEFVAGLGDSRIRYFRTSTFVPVTDNWNKALDHSSGDLVIMLGDDDCLMSGFFTTLLAAITTTHPDPDFIYTSAYLYAYPGVIPGHPDGFLQPLGDGTFLAGATAPFWLSRTTAERLVSSFMSFHAEYGYNMQFFTISRRMIRELAVYGPFFQSPFPDFYAANAMMLKARRILVLPQRLVTIGITPKSFGYYFFNNKEGEGAEFLQDISDPPTEESLRPFLLPGSYFLTSWFFSADVLRQRLGAEFPLRVDVAQYRQLQAKWVYRSRWLHRSIDDEAVHRFRMRLTIGERMRLTMPLAVFHRLRALAPAGVRGLLGKMVRRLRGHRSPLPTYGGFPTIREVFTRVDPVTGPHPARVEGVGSRAEAGVDGAR